MLQFNVWSCEPPPIDVPRLLSVHKYKDMTAIRPRIKKSARSAAERAREISSPQAVFIKAQIEKIDGQGISLNAGPRLTCEVFEDKLSGCTELLVFVITLGPALDKEVSDGFVDGTDPLAPLFLDTAGWLMIEAVTREFSRDMKERHFEEGNSFSPRLAPGYDYRISGTNRRAMWDLSDQQELFSLFGEATLPVELLESGAMVPRMSRSGVFGIRPGL